MSAQAPTLPTRSRSAQATAGAATALAAVGVEWLAHDARPPLPFPPYAVGDWIIRHTPGGLATDAIDRLGHDAQHILAMGCVAAAIALGAVLGHRSPRGLAALATLASGGAELLDPRHPTLPAVATVAGLGGLAALAAATALRPRPQTGALPAADDLRRRLLALGALAIASAALGAAAVRRAGHHLAAGLVRADRVARIVPDPTIQAAAGLSPLVTSRDAHYTVQIDLESPAVDLAGWRLRVRGAVRNPTAWTLDELRAMPTVERLMNMSCISNPVGGPLVGNARWTGVPLDALLRLVEPTAPARFVEARAADGYHDTLALTAARSGEVLVVFAMNGLLLPQAHGFPARLRVPDRYGVKNVKWLTDLVVLDQDQPGYWTERGWDPIATVRTESRIDTPRAGDIVHAPFAIAGVAWAGDRGISNVEVSADDGHSWLPARLESPGDPLSWRRWSRPLVLPEGTHPLTVRATDGHGQPQPADRGPPHPAGATGWHRVVIRVGPNG